MTELIHLLQNTVDDEKKLLLTRKLKFKLIGNSCIKLQVLRSSLVDQFLNDLKNLLKTKSQTNFEYEKDVLICLGSLFTKTKLEKESSDLPTRTITLLFQILKQLEQEKTKEKQFPFLVSLLRCLKLLFLRDDLQDEIFHLIKNDKVAIYVIDYIYCNFSYIKNQEEQKEKKKKNEIMREIEKEKEGTKEKKKEEEEEKEINFRLKIIEQSLKILSFLTSNSEIIVIQAHSHGSFETFVEILKFLITKKEKKRKYSLLIEPLLGVFSAMINNFENAQRFQLEFNKAIIPICEKILNSSNLESKLIISNLFLSIHQHNSLYFVIDQKKMKTQENKQKEQQNQAKMQIEKEGLKDRSLGEKEMQIENENENEKENENVDENKNQQEQKQERVQGQEQEQDKNQKKEKEKKTKLKEQKTQIKNSLSEMRLIKIRDLYNKIISIILNNLPTLSIPKEKISELNQIFSLKLLLKLIKIEKNEIINILYSRSIYNNFIHILNSPNPNKILKSHSTNLICLIIKVLYVTIRRNKTKGKILIDLEILKIIEKIFKKYVHFKNEIIIQNQEKKIINNLLILISQLAPIISQYNNENNSLLEKCDEDYLINLAIQFLSLQINPNDNNNSYEDIDQKLIKGSCSFLGNFIFCLPSWKKKFIQSKGIPPLVKLFKNRNPKNLETIIWFIKNLINNSEKDILELIIDESMIRILVDILKNNIENGNINNNTLEIKNYHTFFKVELERQIKKEKENNNEKETEKENETETEKENETEMEKEKETETEMGKEMGKEKEKEKEMEIENKMEREKGKEKEKEMEMEIEMEIKMEREESGNWKLGNNYEMNNKINIQIIEFFINISTSSNDIIEKYFPFEELIPYLESIIVNHSNFLINNPLQNLRTKTKPQINNQNKNDTVLNTDKNNNIETRDFIHENNKKTDNDNKVFQKQNPINEKINIKKRKGIYQLISKIYLLFSNLIVTGNSRIISLFSNKIFLQNTIILLNYKNFQLRKSISWCLINFTWELKNKSKQNKKLIKERKILLNSVGFVKKYNKMKNSNNLKLQDLANTVLKYIQDFF
ncbi:armadillo repeat-containing protein [Anaeramoeba flamelloides]|uniref:Armadillo repeat-containing protein n=1 Tax=Anaeramoeba flamelloides TaxID=1746091 RepID=A0AAV8AEV9_9EUKA|nr:armadillo repeat-containing protein [Anaeramoeba flamelloides]